MANNVNSKQFIELLNHPDNIRPTIVYPDRKAAKRNSQIRFAEPKIDPKKGSNFRTFGEDAQTIAERGKFDHLREQYQESLNNTKTYQNLSVRNLVSGAYRNSDPITK